MKEFDNGTRTSRPVFIAAAASHAGEVGPEVVSLIEKIVNAFKTNHLKECEVGRLDGKSIDQLTADFRNRFRTSIQFAIAKGTAKMFLRAGLPKSFCRKFNLRRMGSY